MNTQQKRNRLSRAPWAGGYGHYAIVDKRRWLWETVCHVSSSDSEFERALHIAQVRLAVRGNNQDKARQKALKPNTHAQ